MSVPSRARLVPAISCAALAAIAPSVIRPAGAALPALATSEGPGSAAASERQQRFVELLRAYPARRPEESLALLARLVDEGNFRERDRAEYWIASAHLALGEREGARAWFERLGRDYPGSPLAERGLLGLGDLAAQERRTGEALDFYARASGARDAGVRELARLSARQAASVRARQRWAIAACAFAGGVALWLLLSVWRLRPPLRPLPAELRIAGPVLAVLALLSLRQEAAPRAAVLELSAAGALLATLSGLRLRGVVLTARSRAVHAALALAALGAVAYATVERNDLAGAVQETLRAGPD